MNRAENAVSESVFDAISNIATIITLRVKKLVFRAIGHKIDSPLRLFFQNNTTNETKWFLTNMCATLTTAIVLAIYFVTHAHEPQQVLAGNVYLLINYLDKLAIFFFKFTAMVRRYPPAPGADHGCRGAHARLPGGKLCQPHFAGGMEDAHGARAHLFLRVPIPGPP